jgi:hypothetical protein
VRNPAGLFSDDCIIYGGCPLINDFDVMSAVAPAVSQMTYGAATNSPDNDAVISQTTLNPNSVNVSSRSGAR